VELHERVGVSFWDAMILTSARSLGCRILYSEDLNAGQSYDGVVAVNPFETREKRVDGAAAEPDGSGD
jgi:predicted nucleic acid-binding protein